MNVRVKTSRLLAALVFAGCLLSGCIYIMEEKPAGKAQADSLLTTDTLQALKEKQTSVKPPDTLETIKVNHLPSKEGAIDTKGIRPEQIVSFAKTLIGTPYLYGSSNPSYGFDCSGFITYVFRNFGISVPRSSIDFTNVGTTIPIQEVQPGDLILFTGTDSTERFVGHMGIIVSDSAGKVEFIHSTSGKQHGVTITPLSDYYKSRYVKTVRVFPVSISR
ncbi:MAG TPA: C40 family peptidase [Flavisolibacter sp.]|jgi:cell wall-associated NlpC family hydrolase|nr:C40 family peptidase [Flavisolibacter sp.]